MGNCLNVKRKTPSLRFSLEWECSKCGCTNKKTIPHVSQNKHLMVSTCSKCQEEELCVEVVPLSDPRLVPLSDEDEDRDDSRPFII